ncbi:MAG TPA: type II secretion system protein [Candidatus Acidoferrum sp.]|nr:type II secretion system protein [Candidatus Acidoferrum sp.]
MRSGGFTLLEVLLSVGIITILVSLSLPIYATFVQKNDLDLTAQSLANTIRRAQTYNRGAKNDSAWGVEVLSSSYVIFKGTTYAGRDTTADETSIIPASITPSGTAEIDFNKLAGTPTATASITLTSTTTDTRVINVNAKGMVDY